MVQQTARMILSKVNSVQSIKLKLMVSFGLRVGKLLQGPKFPNSGTLPLTGSSRYWSVLAVSFVCLLVAFFRNFLILLCSVGSEEGAIFFPFHCFNGEKQQNKKETNTERLD